MAKDEDLERTVIYHTMRWIGGKIRWSNNEYSTEKTKTTVFRDREI